jgi:hypothetical protein
MDTTSQQATVKTGYSAYILLRTGQLPVYFGDDSVVTIIALESTGAIVELNGIRAYIPYEYLSTQGVHHE